MITVAIISVTLGFTAGMLISAHLAEPVLAENYRLKRQQRDHKGELS